MKARIGADPERFGLSCDDVDMRASQRSADDAVRGEVCRLYESGVAAVVQRAQSWTTDDWTQPACGDWDRADTVRHLCAVTAWYHSWLDRALADDASRPFHSDEFVTRNRTGVDDRQGLTGPGAVAEFEREALTYLSRAKPNWNLAYGFPLGTVTVRLHVGVAATEWHLHAWDLTSAALEPHSPEDPAALFRVAGAAMAQAEGGVRGRLTALLVPIAARRSPWQSMLKRSDRDPTRAGSSTDLAFRIERTFSDR